MKNLIARSLSGIVYVALIVGAILCGNTYFTILMAVFILLGMLEFQKIVMRGKSGANKAGRALDILGALGLCCLPAVSEYNFDGALALICYLMIYPVFRFIAALYDKSESALRDTAMSVLSVSYLGLGIGLFNTGYIFVTTESKTLALAMFVMIWLNDTGAFCVGSLIGRRRLFERLSPKKSWEGFFGGLAFCVLAGYLCGTWLNLPVFNTAEWMLYGLMVCIFSTLGDLFESFIKRTHGIKDSGHLIPGHGGILDRIDSLLFVAPPTFIFLLLSDLF